MARHNQGLGLYIYQLALADIGRGLERKKEGTTYVL